jgi:protein O-GlcNAc transferase
MNCDAELTPDQVFAEHISFGEEVTPREPRVVVPQGPLVSERKLRIGYVSPDFRNHSVAFYIEPVLRQHDRAAFEVFCYSDGLTDEVTARIRALGHTFHDTRTQSDDALAELIARDGIDVLVDLAGHTAHNRLRMFARRAAPIQVAWIGYFATTGVRAVDYRLADAFSVPPELERYFVERVVRLPRSANCYAPPSPSPAVAPAPCLKRGYVTFGCYNHPRKLSRHVAAVYAEILRHVPGSRLKLKYGAYEDPGMIAHVRRWFRDEGIDPARIEASGASMLYRYLEAFGDIDVALDPFPYGGETTALHALWMGVPCVALEGSTLVERLGSRVLRVAGLHDWVASTPADYVAIAARAARDPARLAALRPAVRAAMEASPLLDHAGVTREAEAAFRDMWRSYCVQHALPRTG